MDPSSAGILAGLLRREHIASLGTLRRGEPMVSMVAFAPAADLSELYIHISRLAMHTQNIMKHPGVSLLIYDSGGSAGGLQQLPRVSVSGSAERLERGADMYSAAREVYLATFPEAQAYFELGDFSLYRIVPRRARFVAGFGQIFNLARQDFIEAGRQKV